jgi:hypothetical protein
MKRLIVVALLYAAPALAQQPPQPFVVELPSGVVGAVRQYLGGRPHDEVNGGAPPHS